MWAGAVSLGVKIGGISIFMTSSRRITHPFTGEPCAAEVQRLSPGNKMTVDRNWGEARKGRLMFKKRLVPLDRSDLAESFLPFVNQIARGLDLPYTLLSVVYPEDVDMQASVSDRGAVVWRSGAVD